MLFDVGVVFNGNTIPIKVVACKIAPFCRNLRQLLIRPFGSLVHAASSGHPLAFRTESRQLPAIKTLWRRFLFFFLFNFLCVCVYVCNGSHFGRSCFPAGGANPPAGDSFAPLWMISLFRISSSNNTPTYKEIYIEREKKRNKLVIYINL